MTNGATHMWEPTVQGRPWINVQQASKLLDVTPQTIRNYCRAGLVRSTQFRTRGKIFVRLSDILELGDGEVTVD